MAKYWSELLSWMAILQQQQGQDTGEQTAAQRESGLVAEQGSCKKQGVTAEVQALAWLESASLAGPPFALQG